MADMKGNILTLGLFFSVLSHQVRPIFSGGATFVESSSGWLAVGGSNVTLDCRIPGKANVKKDCARIGFSRNGTLLIPDDRFRPSGPFYPSGTNDIICTMKILRIRVEDAGRYGCCWIDAATQECLHHPWKELTVLPVTTTTATTTTTTTTDTEKSTTDDISGIMPSMPVFTVKWNGSQDLVHKATLSLKIPLQETHSMSKQGEHQKQTEVNLSFIWALIGIIIAAALVLFLIAKYVKKKRSRGRERIPECDQENN